MNTTTPHKVSSKKGSLWLRKGNKIAPYFFISPFFVIFGVFGLFPLLFSLYLSFHYWEPAAGLGAMEWIGIENYVFALQDEWFQKSIYNTVVIALKSGIPQHVVAIPLAFFIHTSFTRWRNTVIGVYFVPYITSTVAISLVFTTLFSRDFGMVNQVLTSLGNFTIADTHVLSWIFPVTNVDWARPEYTKDMISFVVFWRYVGWNTVLYLSALQTIPKDLYEAAIIDGANRYQQFWHITLPLLKPMAFFAVTLTIIGNLQLFEEPFIITGGSGGIDQAGKTAAMHMYLTAFVESDFGTASAISWILFMMIAGLTWMNHKLLGGSNEE